jgi:hypothetical protein
MRFLCLRTSFNDLSTCMYNIQNKFKVLQLLDKPGPSQQHEGRLSDRRRGHPTAAISIAGKENRDSDVPWRATDVTTQLCKAVREM